MMLIASLIELPIAKTRMRQKRNIHSGNFDMATLAEHPCGYCESLTAIGAGERRRLSAAYSGNGA
jgi:hypothetical protein